jgi:hypothetical protein
MPECGALQRLDGTRPVKMDDRVKLDRQARMEVMTRSLGIWPVDYADGSLQPWLAQAGHTAVAAQE